MLVLTLWLMRVRSDYAAELFFYFLGQFVLFSLMGFVVWQF
jgi:hypothetical protein